MDDFYVRVLFFSFLLYLFSCTQLKPHLLIQYSHFSGNLSLHLGLFCTPIYPHRTMYPEISATIFPGGLQATFNESISVAPASVWVVLVLFSKIDGLQSTLNEIVSAALDFISVYYCIGEPLFHLYPTRTLRCVSFEFFPLFHCQHAQLTFCALGKYLCHFTFFFPDPLVPNECHAFGEEVSNPVTLTNVDAMAPKVSPLIFVVVVGPISATPLIIVHGIHIFLHQ